MNKILVERFISKGQLIFLTESDFYNFFHFFDLNFQFASFHPNDLMAHISAGIIDASAKLPYFTVT